MHKTLKGLGFVVLGLAVVTVGLPVLVLVASFLGMLVGAYVFPALIVLASLRALWMFPSAFKYKTMTGEWPFQTIAKRNRFESKTQCTTPTPIATCKRSKISSQK